MNLVRRTLGCRPALADSGSERPAIQGKTGCWRFGINPFSGLRAQGSLRLFRNAPVNRVSDLRTSSRSCRQQSVLQHPEHLGVRRDATTEVQNPASGMRDELRRPVHDLLQHRLDPAALGRMPNRCDVSGQTQLPQQAQAVVGKRRQVQQRVIGVELPGGQPFQVQVGLELGGKQGQV